MIEEQLVDSSSQFEEMMGELPIGSYIKITVASFQVVVPLNGITDYFKSKTCVVFEAKTFAQAYQDAVNFLTYVPRAVEEP